MQDRYNSPDIRIIRLTESFVKLKATIEQKANTDFFKQRLEESIQLSLQLQEYYYKTNIPGSSRNEALEIRNHIDLLIEANHLTSDALNGAYDDKKYNACANKLDATIEEYEKKIDKKFEFREGAWFGVKVGLAVAATITVLAVAVIALPFDVLFFAACILLLLSFPAPAIGFLIGQAMEDDGALKEQEMKRNQHTLFAQNNWAFKALVETQKFGQKTDGAVKEAIKNRPST